MIITACQLTLHDYLFYASREMGRLYETEKYLHNYGLTYALGLAKSSYASPNQAPHYREDLEILNEQGVYVTPAHPIPGSYSFAFHTFKMANVNYYNFTPRISNNQVIFGRAKELAPGSTFEFFILSEREITPPRWIRLGKWMAKASVEVLFQGHAGRKQGNYEVEGALNPLDLNSSPVSCNIIAMAPASLVASATFSGEYYELKYHGGTQKDNGTCLPAGMSYQPVRSRAST